MSKITDKIKVLLQIAKHKFGSIKTEDKEIFYDGDEIAVEKRVYDDAGEAIPDGEYVAEDKIVVVKDSVVTEIRPKEEKKEEETTTTTTTTEEKKEEEMAGEEETITEEVKEEIKENADEPSVEERINSLEELVGNLFEEIRQLKAREVERVAKNEEIIREFNAYKRTPTATSVTTEATAEHKDFACDSKADRLKALKEKK